MFECEKTYNTINRKKKQEMIMSGDEPRFVAMANLCPFCCVLFCFCIFIFLRHARVTFLEYRERYIEMSKTIQQKLRDLTILDANEPILSFIQVADYMKHQQQFKNIIKEEIASLLSSNKTYYLFASSNIHSTFFLFTTIIIVHFLIHFLFLYKVKILLNDSTPMIYLIKVNDKTQEFKLKLSWHLNEVKSVRKIDDKARQPNASSTTTSGASKQTNESSSAASTSAQDFAVFELSFLDVDPSGNASANELRKYLWLCDSQRDRDTFLDTLWKLSEQFLKTTDRPKFINYQIESICTSIPQTRSLFHTCCFFCCVRFNV